MSEPAPKLVVLTNHFINSRRMGNIHWLVREFGRRGYEVSVLVTGFSALARLKGDRRSAYFNPANRRRFETIAPGLRQTCLYTLCHPFNGRALNPLLGALAAIYPASALHREARAAIAEASVVLIESGLPLLFTRQIRRLAPKARLIYRVSDDLAHLRCHPSVPVAEKRFAPCFDCISMQSSLLAYRFPGLPAVKAHPQSIAEDVLVQPRPDPYPARPPGSLRILSVGSSFFDYAGLASALAGESRHVFYIVGDLRKPAIVPPNARYLGELPFEMTLAYVEHCDVALALYDGARAGPSLAESSSKIAQYLYYGKPVVTLDQVAVASRAQGLFAYRADDAASIVRAIGEAVEARAKVPRQRPPLTWGTMVREMLGEATGA